MAAKPLIVISNDDGIQARGILALASALEGLGELCVVAPEHEQSAVGHAVTVRDPVRAATVPFETPGGPIRAWAVSGTPADCIKLGCTRLLDREPDLVVSGINHGPNTSINVLYSGTVSAASEACIMGYPAMAVSNCSWATDADFEAAGHYARHIAQTLLNNTLPPRVLLNINVPDLPLHEIQGIEVTRQTHARWIEEFSPRMDPHNRPYYWLGGRFVNLDDDDQNDLGAIERGYVSVVPMQLDLTAYAHMDTLRGWNWNGRQNG